MPGSRVAVPFVDDELTNFDCIPGEGAADEYGFSVIATTEARATRYQLFDGESLARREHGQ